MGLKASFTTCKPRFPGCSLEHFVNRVYRAIEILLLFTVIFNQVRYILLMSYVSTYARIDTVSGKNYDSMNVKSCDAEYFLQSIRVARVVIILQTS